MCGINGFTFQDSALLRKMHGATRHRGPDDEGFFEAPGISLAHNRLSIIDLSPGGRQPMATPDGRYTIVFNGEIYNYRDIRKELEALGEKFRSASDTEILLHAFSRWGVAALPKLNGIFAFAIWDRDTEELTLVRDHMGIKPLYYALIKNQLIFSSELKAILEHSIVREIDPEAANLYFRFLYVPGPRTIFPDIKKLPQGHYLKFRQGKTEIASWWKIKEGEIVTNRKEATAHIRELIRDSVRLQLVSDRPLGVFLSGGVDSTAILALMREHVSGPIKTFSIGYEATAEAEKYNADFHLAARTAKYFGTEHHPIILSGRDVAANFEDIIRHMDEPVSNHIEPSTYLLAKAAKPLITVALGGDGGDELFGGYGRYWLSAMLDRVRALPAPLRHPAILRLVGRVMGNTDLESKVRTTPGLERFLTFIGQKESALRKFLRPELFQANAGERTFAPWFASQWKDTTNQFMAVDAQTWLPDESLIRTDRLTMAYGLEERVPLLDPRLAEYAYRIPSAWKLGTRTQGKRIMRDALSDLLPPFILQQEKRGFFSPAAKWLRGDLLPYAREVLSDGYSGSDDPYVNLPEARKMLEDHIAKRGYYLNELWAILTFRVWRKMFRA